MTAEHKELLADPVYRKQRSKLKKTFRIRGDELVFALTQAMKVTGDPVFDDALRALRAYGLDTGGYNSIAAQIFGKKDRGYLEQVRYCIEQENMTPSNAAEFVVIHFGAMGQSFENAVERIERTHREKVQEMGARQAPT